MDTSSTNVVFKDYNLGHKRKGNRIIEVNHELNRFIEKARENLLSEKGIAHRKQRP